MMSRTTSAPVDDQKHSPDPDHPDKPDSLGEIEKPSWKYALKKTVAEFGDDECRDLAAALTFYTVLSLFPGLIAVFSLLGVVGQDGEAANAVLGIVREVAPDAAEGLRGPLEEVASSSSAGIALIAGVAVAIWSASAYVGAFSRAMNRIWEIDEGRPFWKRKPAQLAFTLLTIVLAVIGIGLLIISGPVARTVGEALGIGETGQLIWQIAKWPLLVGVVIFFVAALYYFTPNTEQPKFRWVSAGAVIAIVTLALASLGFGIYVANFSSYDRTYGSLAGVVIFLLWVWIANMALLFGAEFDAELERTRELQAGIEAEERIQLPPRDTTQIEKAAEKEEKDLAEARRIRESAREPDDE
ncbi:YihY family inner membrane protein [Microbacterium sp. MEC084]|nr:YihY family inner membrane protein [Microbacterium sp. MEC084]